MGKKSFQIIIICCFALISCKRDKWNEPAAVSFVVDINRSPGLSDKLVFSSGKIVFENFSFEGERVQGDDVYFSNSYPSGLSVTFDANNTIGDLDFDIPQGTFTRIQISFSTYGTSSDNHIEMTGVYSTGRGTTFPLKFEYNAKESFSVMAQNTSGSNEIVLNKDTPVKPKIVFDPIYWFQPVSLNLLNNAEVVDINGTSTILINSTTNIDIYNIVVNRVGDGVKIIF